MYHQGNSQCGDAARYFSIILMEIKSLCVSGLLKACCIKLQSDQKG